MNFKYILPWLESFYSVCSDFSVWAETIERTEECLSRTDKFKHKYEYICV